MIWLYLYAAVAAAVAMAIVVMEREALADVVRFRSGFRFAAGTLLFAAVLGATWPIVFAASYVGMLYVIYRRDDR